MTGETKRHIDAARQVLVGVVPNPASQIDQITNALIYKFMDDMDQSAIKAGGEASFFTGDLKSYAWTRLMDTRIGNQERMNIYSEALLKFSEANQLPELFRDIFKSAFLPYRSPEVLGLFLKEIDYFDYSHPEELGNAYEYLLSVMGSQGDAGQFRTPRHIIDFIVKAVNPTKDDKVLDPACGTGGFLVSAFTHIIEQHDGKDDPAKKERPLTPDQRKNLMGNFEGYDIDPSMVRIARVNMYLHQFISPKIHQYNTLSDEERWSDKFDVILANPPFMSPSGGVSTHSKFSIPSTRSEVLFVDYIMNHLRPKGRAGIIVPEGIIFQSGTSHKQLRKNLVNDGLYAVVSLPSGVFAPYSGVKTSILLFNTELAKTSTEILFVKIENDGFDLGAQRRVSTKNDLPTALDILEKWNSGEKVENKLAVYVEKSKIAEGGDYNLSGDRYRIATDYTNAKWSMVKLGDVCDVYQPKTITSKEIKESGKYKVFGANGVIGYFDEYNHEDAEVAVTCRGATCGTVNFTEPRSWITGNAMVIKPKESNLDKRYLFFLLRSTNLSSVITGAAQPQITGAALKPFLIPLPPLEVQEQIVAELDGYSGIIAGAKQIVQNWKPKIDVDPEWEKVKLSEVCDLKNGCAFKSSDYIDKSNTLNFRMSNIKPGGISDINYNPRYLPDSFVIKYKEFLLEENDLVVAMTDLANDPKILGIPTIVKTDGRNLLLNQRVGKIVNKDESRISLNYLAIALMDDRIKEYYKTLGGGGLQVNISKQDILSVEITLPPLVTQKQIVEKIESERTLVESAKKLIDIYEAKTKESIAKLWVN
jgi:type I restriction enzyme M protein